MRTLFLAIALTTLLATGASAYLPGVIWFYDGMNYADNSLLWQMPGWTGNGVGPLVIGGRALMNGGAGSNYDANSQPSSVAAVSTGKNPQIFHAIVKGQTLTAGSGNACYIYMQDSTGAELGRWYGDSTHLTPRYGGNVGPAVSLADGLNHDLDMVYNPVLGTTTWYSNGVQAWTFATGAGKKVGWVDLSETNRGTTDYVWIDEVALGTPEPSSLLALSAFGVGLIGYIKRRR